MSSYPVKSPKKLIEVALPLDAINAAASREKSIRHGHPSTLHLWWARRPLAATRAVIFAQHVNDPASLWEAQNPEGKPSLQQRGGFTQRRNYLFQLISEMVTWENTTNEQVLKRARKEIRDAWREVCALNRDHPDAATLFDTEKPPGLHDPFAGGGAIPLEAQRLGLDAYASDLNPIPVLLNKAMIEIPPKFAGRTPVHPRSETRTHWQRADGLASDIRHYGAWMREEAEKRIGHIYPKMTVTRAMSASRPDLHELAGQQLTVIAWLWARTVKSPNPAFAHVDVPLLTSFELCSKAGSEAWLDPRIDGDKYTFNVQIGPSPSTAAEGTKASGRGADFRCLLSAAPISATHIRAEAKAGRLNSVLVAVVAEGPNGRLYFPATEDHIRAAEVEDAWGPDTEFFQDALGFRVGNYGMTKWSDLFSRRQRLMLNALFSLAGEAGAKACRNAEEAAFAGGGDGIESDGRGPRAYGEAITLYLSLAVSRVSDKSSMLAWWMGGAEKMAPTFSRPTLSMVWDWAEMNPLCSVTSNFSASVKWVAEAVEFLPACGSGTVKQQDAQTQAISTNLVVSTDPPYYDNIGYADLSDYFYVWLRHYLGPILPTLFATMNVPKSEELVATPARHGGKVKAQDFFLRGMTHTFEGLARSAHPAFPVSIFYAFKQSETKDVGGTSSTGWETFLAAVLSAGFAVTGTWPVRTERSGGLRERDRNSLASSVVLVCRGRLDSAVMVSRREFVRELNAVLPIALDDMTRGSDSDHSPVAPVDLSQAIIGPGMAVFSKYAAVLEADGTPMTVKTALQLINRFLAEDDFDGDTQFCLHWFDQHGWNEGAYGDADVLARAKATSVGGLDQAGVLVSGGGKVRLLRPAEYPADWDPNADKRLPVWEALHHLVRAFKQDGESGAGRILGVVKSKTEAIRQLAYRLYTLCERRGWADDARAYNELVTSWSSVETVANAIPESAPKQQHLFGERR